MLAVVFLYLLAVDEFVVGTQLTGLQIGELPPVKDILREKLAAVEISWDLSKVSNGWQRRRDSPNVEESCQLLDD